MPGQDRRRHTVRNDCRPKEATRTNKVIRNTIKIPQIQKKGILEKFQSKEKTESAERNNHVHIEYDLCTNLKDNCGLQRN